MTNQIDISLIIPVFNEEEAVPQLLIELERYFATLTKSSEVIFVDDGSSDNTFEILQKFKSKFFNSKVISLSKNFGSHAALRAGMSVAVGTYTIFLYADLQDPLTLIHEMISEIEKSKDTSIVVAVRKDVQSGLIEYLFSRLHSTVIQKFVAKDYPQKGFDVLMFKENVRQVVNQEVESHTSIFLQIFTLGFKKRYVYYNKLKRNAGKTKWTFAKKIKLLIDSLIGFTYFPIRFISVSGILISFCGFLFLVSIIIRRFVYNDLTPGWPALVSCLMVGFGFTNFSLGIIAEYLWRTLEASRGRKVYIIEKLIDNKQINS